jgi:signal transduction histidine kinase
METIIRNLISNAIKFSNRGGTIRILAWTDDNSLHLTVADHGIGMTREQIETITHNGGYSTRGTANEKGAGIGLTLVREFTAKHRGKLNITSEPGNGSQFTIILPREE